MYFSRVLEAEKSPSGMRSGEDVFLIGAMRFLHPTASGDGGIKRCVAPTNLSYKIINLFMRVGALLTY